MEQLWPIITIVGSILLAVVILYAVMRNRRISAGERARTERATRTLYAEEDRATED